ncbi:MAG: hypothetical protein NZT92_10055 [Abditibacteriales bacterium]|nr:hypothetical protein [Abditibacteriales bacterium]MDW8366748.1 CsgG/HfaB family protein [Abditibacteriales bacterium]
MKNQRVLVALRLLPLSFYLLPFIATTWAQAQVPQQKTVVFDFVVESGVDPGLSAKAADALATELNESQRYDVVTRDNLDKILSDARLQGSLPQPLDKSAQLKIARLLEATTTFTGRVRRALALDGRGIVELEVFQMDVVAEELINGARAIGDTGMRDDVKDPDQLISIALNRAAYEAVREMERTVLPEGTVLVVDSFGEVTLNIGIRQGVRPGQLYMVTRQEYRHVYSGTDFVEARPEVNRVGTIRILSVEANQSTARIVWSRRGAQTGDKVRQIFALGSGAVGETFAPPKKERAKTKSVGPRY